MNGVLLLVAIIAAKAIDPINIGIGLVVGLFARSMPTAAMRWGVVASGAALTTGVFLGLMPSQRYPLGAFTTFAASLLIAGTALMLSRMLARRPA